MSCAEDEVMCEAEVCCEREMREMGGVREPWACDIYPVFCMLREAAKA